MYRVYPPYLSLLCLLHPRLDVVYFIHLHAFTFVYPVYKYLPWYTSFICIQLIFTCVYFVYHIACVYMFNYFTSVYIHESYSPVYIYVAPVSENFILTMMIKLEVMMSMRRMTVTMTWMVTDCISTTMKITREMKTKMMYK